MVVTVAMAKFTDAQYCLTSEAPVSPMASIQLNSSF